MKTQKCCLKTKMCLQCNRNSLKQEIRLAKKEIHILTFFPVIKRFCGYLLIFQEPISSDYSEVRRILKFAEWLETHFPVSLQIAKTQNPSLVILLNPVYNGSRN